MKKKSFRNRKLFIYAAFWIFVIGIFMSVILIQRSKTIAYRDQVEELRQELSEHVAAADALRQEQRDMYSPENVEKKARELLGFVYPDEIVFFDANH